MLATVASEGTGIAELAAALDRHFAHLAGGGRLEERRARRAEARTREVIERAVRRWVWSDGQREEMQAVLRDVAAGLRSPYEAAAGVIERLQGSVTHGRD